MFDSLGQMLRNSIDQIGKLTPTARLLVIMTAVVVAMLLILVGVYAGSPDRIELYSGADAEFKSQASITLRASGIDSKIDSQGRLLVQPGQADQARGLLASEGVMPSDGTLLFSNLSEQMKWTNPREVNENLRKMALQNELARTISNFPMMKRASVFLDIPVATGIGMVVRQPTASITVFSKSGSPVKQNEVDAIARLVSHSVSGLELSNISVIDGTSGVPLAARGEENASASNYLEHKLSFEREVEKKIRGILSSIPGAIVAVTADVDMKRISSVRNAFLEPKAGSVQFPSSTMSSLEESLGANTGAEAGTRPNTGADINQGGGGSGGFTNEQITTEFESRIGSEVTNTVDPRGMATSLSISVQVPRGYIEALMPIPEGTVEGEAAVYDIAAVQAAFASEQTRIQQMVEPHIPGAIDDQGERTLAGTVVVSMMPIDLSSLAGTAQAASLGLSAMGSSASSGGGLGGLTGSGTIEKGVLGALALVAFVMMFMMVRGATKRVELPSVAELVGIPPALKQDSTIVGEADESETPMDGIEVDQEHVASSKMLEQVADLVGNEPDLAARLLNRWIQPES